MKLFKHLFILFLYLNFIHSDDFALGLNVYRSTVTGVSRDSKTVKVLLPILLGFKTAGVLIIALIITTVFTLKSVIAAKLAFSVTLALIVKKFLNALSKWNTPPIFFNDNKSKFNHGFDYNLPTKFYYVNQKDKPDYFKNDYHVNNDQLLINDHFVESENRNEKYRVIDLTSSTSTVSTTVSHRRRSDYISLRNQKQRG